jgi:hypothetical protein
MNSIIQSAALIGCAVSLPFRETQREVETDGELLNTAAAVLQSFALFFAAIFSKTRS